MDQWAIKDPVENYRKFLKENKILTTSLTVLRVEIKKDIDLWLLLMLNLK
jgi:2-oxoisovalerate dehydrogenase E1 component